MDAITRLAGGIAHDFNNLLVVILGYSDFILSNLDSSHPLHRDLVEIKTAGEQAKELTRQLLSFGGRREAEAEELDLCGLVREGLPLIRRVVGEGVDLLLRTPPTSMTVNADSSQLRQALLHMVVHARDHSPDQAPVELVVDSVDLGEETESLGAVELGRASLKPGSYARIRVSARITAEAADEPDETQYRASRFDPDLPLATPERYGFGLSVVHGIAEQVDGTLQIEQSGDVLSTTIFLPRIHSLHDAGSNGPAFSAQLNSRTIVLVEDNSMVRSLVRHILSDQGYRVLVASSGEEAMHICAEHKSRVDLLLTDVVMPRVGGRELADRLRAMIPGLPVLYMSGYTGDQLSEHGVSEDHAFIPKPFTSEELGRKVREVLNGVEEEDL